MNIDYQRDSKVLYTFVPNQPFGQLLDISPKNFVFLKLLVRVFYILKYGLLIISSTSLEMEGKINITLAINERVLYKI